MQISLMAELDQLGRGVRGPASGAAPVKDGQAQPGRHRHRDGLVEDRGWRLALDASPGSPTPQPHPEPATQAVPTAHAAPPKEAPGPAGTGSRPAPGGATQSPVGQRTRAVSAITDPHSETPGVAATRETGAAETAAPGNDQTMRDAVVVTAAAEAPGLVTPDAQADTAATSPASPAKMAGDATEPDPAHLLSTRPSSRPTGAGPMDRAVENGDMAATAPVSDEKSATPAPTPVPAGANRPERAQPAPADPILSAPPVAPGQGGASGPCISPLQLPNVAGADALPVEPGATGSPGMLQASAFGPAVTGPAGPGAPTARPLTGESAVRLRAVAEPPPTPAVPISDAAISPPLGPAPVPKPDNAALPAAAMTPALLVARPVSPPVSTDGAAPERQSGEVGAFPSDPPGSGPDTPPTLQAKPISGGIDPLSGQMLMASAQAAPAPDRFQPPLAQSPPVPVLAQDVARQLAGALAQGPVTDAAPVELVLSPAELGTVRMVLHTRGDSVSLSVWADRADTHDMLRRHSDILAEELRGSGFANVSFDFSQQRRNPHPQPQSLPTAAAQAYGMTRPPVASADLPRPPPVQTGSGLDLRL